MYPEDKEQLPAHLAAATQEAVAHNQLDTLNETAAAPNLATTNKNTSTFTYTCRRGRQGLVCRLVQRMLALAAAVVRNTAPATHAAAAQHQLSL